MNEKRCKCNLNMLNLPPQQKAERKHPKVVPVHTKLKVVHHHRHQIKRKLKKQLKDLVQYPKRVVEVEVGPELPLLSYLMVMM